MVQALWYVRKSGQVSGPFPAPQIDEALRTGEIALTDDLSLDGEQWLPVRESGMFRGKVQSGKTTGDTADATWLAEREKARQRWEDGVAENSEPATPTPILDTIRIQSLRANHDATRAMVDAEAKRRPSILIAFAALIALVLTGALVWFGQGDDTIKASIGKVSNCAAAPATGISWAGCDKSGQTLRGVDLHSMTLTRANFDGAALARANLSYADLARASLRGANLAGANLLGANLDGADLTGADLSQADLRYATLNNSLLGGSRLDGATLGKTTWIGGQLCDRLDQCR